MDRAVLMLETPADRGPSPSQNLVMAARGGGIVFLGRLFEYASRFVFGFIVARALGANGFGLYTLGVTTATILSAIARLGLSEGMVHFLPAALHDKDEGRVWGILQVGLVLPAIISIVLAVALAALADILADGLFQDPAMAPALRWISLSVPLITVGRLLMAATRGFQYMRYEVYADSIVFSLSRIGVTLLLLAIGLGLPGALSAYTVAWVATDAVLAVFLDRLFSLRRPLRSGECDPRKIVAFSLPVCLTQVVSQLGGSFALLLLGLLSTIAAVGVYSAAMRIQMVGIMFLTAAELVAKPIIADLYHRDDRLQLGTLYRTLTRWSVAFILPYFATVILFAEPILKLFGEDFEAGSVVLVIVSVGTLFNAGTGICGAMIVMTGHSKITFINSVIATLVSIILYLVLIPAWGLVGAAMATAMSVVIVNLLRLGQVYWLLKLWPFSWEFVKPLSASIVALLAGYAMRRVLSAERSIFFLALDIGVLWSVYAGAILLLGLSAKDRMVLSRAQRRLRAVLTGR